MPFDLPFPFTLPRLFRSPAISNFFSFPLGLRNSGDRLQSKLLCRFSSHISYFNHTLGITYISTYINLFKSVKKCIHYTIQLQLSFVRMYVPPVTSKQLPHFCSIIIGSQKIRILDMEFCIDLLFYIGIWVSNNSKKTSCTVYLLILVQVIA